MGTVHVVSPSGFQAQYEEAQLRSLWDRGSFEPGTLYWRDGMADWRPLEECFGAVARAVPVTNPRPGTFAAPALAVGVVRPVYTKDPRTLTAIVTIMLIVSIAAAVVFLLSNVGQMSLLSRPFTEAEVLANNSRQLLVGLSCLATLAITSIALLVWIHRASVNCHGFGGLGMRFTPGQAVGSFFIPFVWFWQPYQAVREIWQVSHGPADWQGRPAGLVGAWWGLAVAGGAMWFIARLVGRVAQMAPPAQIVAMQQGATTLWMIWCLVQMLWLVLAIWLVQAVFRAQEELTGGERTEVDADGWKVIAAPAATTAEAGAVGASTPSARRSAERGTLVRPAHRAAPAPAPGTASTADTYSLADSATVPSPAAPAAPAPPTCPKCGAAMKRRTAHSGEYAGQTFWVCTGYPTCKGIRRAKN